MKFTGSLKDLFSLRHTNYGNPYFSMVETRSPRCSCGRGCFFPQTFEVPQSKTHPSNPPGCTHIHISRIVGRWKIFFTKGKKFGKLHWILTAVVGLFCGLKRRHASIVFPIMYMYSPVPNFYPPFGTCLLYHEFLTLSRDTLVFIHEVIEVTIPTPCVLLFCT